MAVNLPPTRTIDLNNWAASGDGKVYGHSPLGDFGSAIPSVYLPAQPSWAQSQLAWLGWATPRYAYVGADMDFTIPMYDWENRTLLPQLDSAPSGATIDSNGTITYTPIVGQLGDQTFTVSLAGLGVSKTFTVTVVNTSGTGTNVIFMATGGSDAADGSESTPVATLDEAAARFGGEPGLILARAGTYSEVFASTPFAAETTRDADNVLRLTAYPGETVVIDSGNTEGTFINVSGYILADKIHATGFTMAADQNYGAFVVTSTGCLIRSRASESHWEDNANVSGICMHSGALVYACDAFENFDTTPSNNNSFNFAFYGDRGTGGAAFLIDSYGYGYNLQNIKVKHAGSGGALHVHRCVAEGGANPISVDGDYSSVRHSISVPSLTSPIGYGSIATQGAALNPYSRNGMLWQNNLIVIAKNTNNKMSGLDTFTGKNQLWDSAGVNAGMLVQGNKVIAVSAITPNRGNPLRTYNPTGLNEVFKDNDIFAVSDDGMLYAEQTTGSYNLTQLNALGASSGNTRSAVPATFDFECGGGTTLGTSTWRLTTATNDLSMI